MILMDCLIEMEDQVHITNDIRNPCLDCVSNWIHCICVVTFDIELGQAMELIYPPSASLEEEDKMNICYLAFPDSNSSYMGDTQFQIRVKQTTSLSLSDCHTEYNNNAPIFLQINPNYFFGHVYFRQVKDQAIPRGYFQKSVVILTKLPFVNLFSEICNMIAPAFFDNGISSFEAACHDMNRWQKPTPGSAYKLPLFGTIIQGDMPSDKNITCSPMNGLSTSTCSMSVFYSSAYDVNMYEPFHSIIYHIHTLWELVLTAEPLVVLAPSPSLSSRLVLALVSMIQPLSYSADYRPYFTIHDSEFKEYMTKTRSPPSVILGVTNPFFGKTLQHWPHIIRLSDSTFTNNVNKQKLKRNDNLTLFDAKAGVYTHYKPFLHKDKAVIKKIIKGMQAKKASEIQSVIVRKHLLELTESFMIPLERYIATLMPLKKNISPYKSSPRPTPFNPDDFIASLESSGPQLTTTVKGDWVGLYKKFFRSANFNGWFNTRYKAMAKRLKILHLESLSHANIEQWSKGKQEVERVEMIIQIRKKIEEANKEKLPLNEIVQIRLKNKLNEIIKTLPEDLRGVINVGTTL